MSTMLKDTTMKVMITKDTTMKVTIMTTTIMKDTITTITTVTTMRLKTQANSPGHRLATRVASIDH